MITLRPHLCLLAGVFFLSCSESGSQAPGGATSSTGAGGEGTVVGGSGNPPALTAGTNAGASGGSTSAAGSVIEPGGNAGVPTGGSPTNGAGQAGSAPAAGGTTSEPVGGTSGEPSSAGGAPSGGASGAGMAGAAVLAGTGGGPAGGADAAGGSGGEAPNDPDARRLLLRDEALSQLSYVDLANSDQNWTVGVPAGRDMQLVGSGLVLIGTENGYEEYDIATGSKQGELTSYPGTIAARRLRNRNTLLVGLDWQGQSGIVLVEVDSAGSVVDTIVYPGFGYVRLVRETPEETLLVTSDATVFEGDADGNVLWQATVTGSDEPHAWQALRLSSGETVVSAGYAASIQVFSEAGDLVDTLSGPESVNPHFFASLQVLQSGNYVVTNWQGHEAGLGTSGVQLLEYDPQGNLAWSWQQDPSFISSLQAAIVLDGLDLNQLHVEDETGVLAPVP